MSQLKNKGKGSPKPFQKPCSAQQLVILLMRGNSRSRDKSCRGVLAVRNRIPPGAERGLTTEPVVQLGASTRVWICGAAQL